VTITAGTAGSAEAEAEAATQPQPQPQPQHGPVAPPEGESGPQPPAGSLPRHPRRRLHHEAATAPHRRFWATLPARLHLLRAVTLVVTMFQLARP